MNYVSCTSKCDYFKSAKTIENKKQLDKITLKESIKLYNSLNNKIIPKFVHEDTSKMKKCPKTMLNNQSTLEHIITII